MYTIKELADVSGVSTRTLRYYDTIDLLKPAEMSLSGYRLYDKASVSRLQHVLFYKELGLPLKEIKEILDNPTFDELNALERHKILLTEEVEKVKQLIKTIDKTLLEKKGMIKMTDSEKFKGLKRELLKDNKETYGEELESSYGSKQVTEANKQFMNLTEDDFDQWKKLENLIIEKLKDHLGKNTISEGEKVELGNMHRKWLSFTWDKYSKGMHRGLIDMYLADDRFKTYYDDRAGKGATLVLVDAVKAYIDDLDKNN